MEATCLFTNQRLTFDATVRCPTARSYLESAAPGRSSASHDGYACEVAASDKARRYPEQDGLKVQTCAVEAYGRIGDDFLEALAHLDHRAHQEDIARNLPTTRWFPRWLDHISCGVARGVARSMADALGMVIAEVPR